MHVHVMLCQSEEEIHHHQQYYWTPQEVCIKIQFTSAAVFSCCYFIFLHHCYKKCTMWLSYSSSIAAAVLNIIAEHCCSSLLLFHTVFMLDGW